MLLRELDEVLFADQEITGKNVQENLLRLKVPDPQIEKDEIWEATHNYLLMT